MDKETLERFWSKVDVRSDDECWLWKAGAGRNGLGVFSVGYKTISARRFAWIIANDAKPPARVEIHTTCGNAPCCNPKHLFLATLEERLERGFEQGQPDDCWIWQGAKTAAGYGVLRLRGTNYFVHRLSWANARRPIPEGLHILHRCDNPACVNPKHLFLGTPAINMADAAKKGRNCHGEDHPRSKLTEKQVREIRYLLDLGVPATKVAHKFNVHHKTIAAIKWKRTWKHVT